MSTIRTFIAVSISDESRQAISYMTDKLRKLAQGLRWVPSKNIHLTLKFLGDVNENRLPELKNAIDQSIVGLKSFQFNISGVGCFPNCNRPRVLWVGIEDVTNNLFHLHKNIEKEFIKSHFKKENRKFNPHLTIARVKDNRNLGKILDKFQNYELGVFKNEVSKVTLMKSDLLPAGARYTPLYEAKII